LHVETEMKKNAHVSDLCAVLKD